MHELVPHHQMLQDSLHSFIFSLLKQKQFLQVTEEDPFYLSVSKPIDKQIIFLLHNLKMVMQSEIILPFIPASIMQNLKYLRYSQGRCIFVFSRTHCFGFFFREHFLTILLFIDN